jgi:UDP-N-acetylglucosamine acyltransferase
MKRKGYTRDDIHRLRRANSELFADSGTFAERLESVTKKYAGDAVVGKVIAFIQQGSSRALVQPARGGDAETSSGPA